MDLSDKRVVAAIAVLGAVVLIAAPTPIPVRRSTAVSGCPSRPPLRAATVDPDGDPVDPVRPRVPVQGHAPVSPKPNQHAERPRPFAPD